jgi:hypothetical protein
MIPRQRSQRDSRRVCAFSYDYLVVFFEDAGERLQTHLRAPGPGKQWPKPR